jgi:hypothetical protein
MDRRCSMGIGREEESRYRGEAFPVTPLGKEI